MALFIVQFKSKKSEQNQMAEQKQIFFDFDNRFRKAGEAASDPNSPVYHMIDRDTWKLMSDLFVNLRNIVTSHPEIFEDQKSIFVLVSCYLRFIKGRDIHFSLRQSKTVYMLVWILAPKTNKGNKSKEPEPKTPRDPVQKAIRNVKVLVQKYFYKQKNTGTTIVTYSHEALNAQLICTGKYLSVHELASQMLSIQKRIPSEEPLQSNTNADGHVGDAINNPPPSEQYPPVTTTHENSFANQHQFHPYEQQRHNAYVSEVDCEEMLYETHLLPPPNEVCHQPYEGPAGKQEEFYPSTCDISFLEEILTSDGSADQLNHRINDLTQMYYNLTNQRQ